jgi:hypothetical protein
MDQLSLDVIVTRGALMESRHHVHAAVVNASGTLIAAARDPELVTHWRSSAKPFQIMPLIESGGFDALAWGDDQLALGCASHGGEPEHVAIADGMLTSIGMEEGDLACGPHEPLSQRGQRALRESGERPTRLHNNCSGKHAAMLARAHTAGWSTFGYERADEREQIADQRARVSAGRAALAQVRPRDDERTEHRDPDPEPLAPARRLAKPDGRQRGDDHRLGIHQHDRRRDAGERDRRVPAPEVKRERDARGDRDGQLAPMEPAPLAPLPGERQRQEHRREGETEAPRRDGERVGVREPDERPRERHADERESEDAGRSPVRPRARHRTSVSA